MSALNDCQPECDGTLHATKWNMCASLTSAYNASVEFADPCNSFGCFEEEDEDGNPVFNPDPLFLQPIEINMNSSTTLKGITDVDPEFEACLAAGDQRWVYGVMASNNRTHDLMCKTYSVRVSSFVDRLRRKVINSHHTKNLSARDVLTDLAVIYAGLDPSMFDFSEVCNEPENCVCGPVSGNDMFAEMQKIAHVGSAYLFVDRDGKLVAKKWKLCKEECDQSGTRFTVPPEFVIKATKTQSYVRQPSRVRVRGCWISCLEKGQRPNGATLVDGATPAGEPYKSCTICTRMDEDGNVQVSTRTDIVTGQAGSNSNSGVGGVRNEAEYLGYPNVANLISQQYANLWWLNSPFLYPFSTTMPIGLTGSSDGTTSDFNNVNRGEVVVDAEKQFEEFGLVYQEIDNAYVFCKSQAFKIAVQRLLEAQYAENAWELELAFIPCLNLYDTIEVTTPCTKNAPGTTLKGFVTSICVDSDTRGCATMKITMVNCNCVCEQKYCAYNLFRDPCLEGTGVYNNGTVSGQDPQTFAPNLMTVAGGVVNINMNAAGVANFCLTEPCMPDFTDTGACLEPELVAKFILFGDNITVSYGAGTPSSSVTATNAGVEVAIPVTGTGGSQDFCFRVTSTATTNLGIVNIQFPRLESCVTI